MMPPAVPAPAIAAAFNEWMRRYTDEPERFRREWEVVGEYLAQRAAGTVPTYGERCAEYLRQLVIGESAAAQP